MKMASAISILTKNLEMYICGQLDRYKVTPVARSQTGSVHHAQYQMFSTEINLQTAVEITICSVNSFIVPL